MSRRNPKRSRIVEISIKTIPITDDRWRGKAISAAIVDRIMEDKNLALMIETITTHSRVPDPSHRDIKIVKKDDDAVAQPGGSDVDDE